MPSALIPLADGVEEMEAVILIDVLRRAEWNVVSVGLQDRPVTASRGVRLLPDKLWSEVDTEGFDWLILPGGLPGTQKLIADGRVIHALQVHARAGKRIGAICAAPTVLHAAGLLAGKTVTSHPSVAARLGDARRTDQRVVIDGSLVTSQGPGTGFEFALKLVELEQGPDKANALAEGMVCAPAPT